MPGKQPLITNYFKSEGGEYTNTTFEDSWPAIVALLSPEYKLVNTFVQVDEYGSCKAYLKVGFRDVYVGYLDLMEDSGSYWVNNVWVAECMRRCGIATKMYLAARKKLKMAPILFSTNPKADDDDDDTRHLSEEGAALANGLAGKGCMK